jgi:hypothetical protein
MHDAESKQHCEASHVDAVEIHPARLEALHLQVEAEPNRNANSEVTASIGAVGSDSNCCSVAISPSPANPSMFIRNTPQSATPRRTSSSCTRSAALTGAEALPGCVAAPGALLVGLVIIRTGACDTEPAFVRAAQARGRERRVGAAVHLEPFAPDQPDDLGETRDVSMHEPVSCSVGGDPGRNRMHRLSATPSPSGPVSMVDIQRRKPRQGRVAAMKLTTLRTALLACAFMQGAAARPVDTKIDGAIRDFLEREGIPAAHVSVLDGDGLQVEIDWGEVRSYARRVRESTGDATVATAAATGWIPTMRSPLRRP